MTVRELENEKELQNLKNNCKTWSMKVIVDNIASAGMEFQAQGDVEKFKETKRILLNEIRRRFRVIKK